MTFKKGYAPLGGSFEWMKNIEYKLPQIVAAVLMLFVVFVVWESPPSFLSYSSLSASQSQTFFSSRPASNEYSPASTSSESPPADIPTVDSDSHSAEQESEPKNSASPVNNTPINQIDATSDVFAEEDTKPVEESAVQVPDAQLQPAEEKYLIPLLNWGGAGNQLIEYKSAATMARALNRTLCLIPFFTGPTDHFGHLGDWTGLVMEDRYDTEILSKYVKVISMDECVRKCEGRVDEHWRLENCNWLPDYSKWFHEKPKSRFDSNNEYRKWTSTADVAAFMGPRNDLKCVGLDGLFPGLEWRGMLYATSTYMQHSKRIMKAADFYQKRALGSNDSNFLSVHWRFEEMRCKRHPLGLCFRRCIDGAVMANGHASETWNNMTHEGKQDNGKTGINGVLVSRQDVSGAIYDLAVQHGMHNVYLATDGWLRGPAAVGILKWVVEDLRSKGLNVSGLWVVRDLPNFADGFYVHPAAMTDLFGLDKSENVSNYMIALVEEEICLRSSVFMGTGQSTWSLNVGFTRAGLRLAKGLNLGTPQVMEQEIIDKILSIQYPSWPPCFGNYNATMNDISIAKTEGEAQDRWLDYASCENRLLQGVGQCVRIKLS